MSEDIIDEEARWLTSMLLAHTSYLQNERSYLYLLMHWKYSATVQVYISQAAVRLPRVSFVYKILSCDGKITYCSKK